MTLKSQLQDDLKTALRERDAARVSILRLALAGIQQREVDERKALDEAGVAAVITKMIKQGREAHRQFEDAGRADLAAKELGEITTLEAYLPEALDADALGALIEAAIAESGASTVRDMGTVMGIVKAKAAGRADMAAASALVRARLGG